MATTQAYYDTAKITVVKSFIVQAPGLTNIYKTSLKTVPSTKTVLLPTVSEEKKKIFITLTPDLKGRLQLQKKLNWKTNKNISYQPGPVL